MTFLRPNLKRWPLALLAFVLGALPTLAHEKWFVESGVVHGPNRNAEILNSPYGLFVLASAVTFMLVFWRLTRRWDLVRIDRGVAKWTERWKLHPRPILSAVMGVSLMGAGLQWTLFAPNLELPMSTYGSILAWGSIFVGQAMIFFETLLPELSILMILLYVAGFAVIPPLDLLEELLIVGIGVYFITSETRRRPWKDWNSAEVRRKGYHAFRLIVGFGFLILSMVKWLRPDLGVVLVENYPINFAAWAGVDPIMYVYAAGVIETTVALAIIFRVAFRPAVIIAFIFFTLSIYVFGFRELLGHLPIKAALYLLFVHGHWLKPSRTPEASSA